MGVKVCMEQGCWWPAPNGARCVEHERAHQAARNADPKRRAYRAASYRGLSLVGQQCWCCGTTEDLTRHHVHPIAVMDKPWAGPAEAVIPLCRSCNSSVGAKIMGGFTCPQHGGVER